LTKLNLQPNQLVKIGKLARLEKGRPFVFLGFLLNLDTGDIVDLLDNGKSYSESNIQLLTVLLYHYSLANPTQERGKLVKFGNLPGGHAYENAFAQRAVQPIERIFCDKPEELIIAARMIGGKLKSFGDASVHIQALPGIPIVYVLWGANEFPASANILFDESASCFLPTEDLAVLGEFTTQRLIEIKTITRNKE
jgi:Domain of unknown function (DUF3786)